MSTILCISSPLVVLARRCLGDRPRKLLHIGQVVTRRSLSHGVFQGAMQSRWDTRMQPWLCRASPLTFRASLDTREASCPPIGHTTLPSEPRKMLPSSDLALYMFVYWLFAETIGRVSHQALVASMLAFQSLFKAQFHRVAKQYRDILKCHSLRLSLISQHLGVRFLYLLLVTRNR